MRADFDIIHLPAVLLQVVGGGILQGGIIAVACLHGLRHGLQFAEQARCFPPLFGRQVLVAAGQRQSVFRAPRIDGNNPHGDVQIVRHALDDGQLLIIFFAEAGGIGLHDVEQLAHHGGHAAEMVRAELAAQFVLQVRRFDLVILPHARIKLLLARREQHAHAGIAQFGGIFFQRARILVEIFALPELQAVHKHAHHNVFGGGTRLGDQCQMACVQVAHGRHEGDAVDGFAPSAQLGNGVDNLHNGFRLMVDSVDEMEVQAAFCRFQKQPAL